MSQKTLLQLTNLVLVRLREDQVTDLTDTYAYLVASFVSDVIDDLNNNYEWDELNHAMTFHTVANQSTYNLAATITSGGDADNTNTRVTNEQSVLLYAQNNDPMAWYYDSDSDLIGKQIKDLSSLEMRKMQGTAGDQTTSNVQYFSVEPDHTAGGMKVRLWPTPTQVKPVTIWFNTTETRFDPATDSARVTLMDTRMVQLGALFLALNERGEEIGEPGNIAETRYNEAIAAAIETQIRNKERTGTYDWSRN
jgi:hypothetical protein